MVMMAAGTELVIFRTITESYTFDNTECEKTIEFPVHGGLIHPYAGLCEEPDQRCGREGNVLHRKNVRESPSCPRQSKTVCLQDFQNIRSDRFHTFIIMQLSCICQEGRENDECFSLVPMEISGGIGCQKRRPGD